MRHSLGAKIFVVILVVLLLMFVVQAIFLRIFFQDSYWLSLRRELETGLSQTAADFAYGGEKVADSAVHAFMQNSGNPLIVLDEAWRVADRNFFDCLSHTAVTTLDGENILLLTGYVQQLSNTGTLLSIFQPGRMMMVDAARLGNSNYYEPMILTVNNISYTQRQTVRRYKQSQAEIEVVDAYGRIGNTRYVALGEAGLEYHAQLLYEHIKPCLLEKQNIEEYLDDLQRKVIEGSHGTNYQLASFKSRYEGSDYYFISLRQVEDFSGLMPFLNRYTQAFYGVLLLMMVLAAYLLSRHLSGPLIQLSEVTERIAGLDFEARAEVRSQDQMGRLATNINDMSAKLHDALRDLQGSNADLARAAQSSRDNEVRLRMLLADLAHEFKTPLGVISGFSEIIENELYEQERSYYFRIIGEEIDRLSSLVDDTSEMSRLGSGYWPVSRKPVPAQEIIGGALDTFSLQLREQGFTVEQQVENLMLLVDERRMGQVFRNLFSNALKYSGEVKHLRVHVRRLEPHRAWVEVCNCGLLADQDRAKIWQRYYRGQEQEEYDKAGRMVGEGLGLGIVRSILLQHDSEYGVEQRGAFVCFYFTLPLAVDNLQPKDE